MRNHNEYTITSTRLVKKNKKLQQQYQLTSTLPGATNPADKFITEFDGDKGSVFVLSSDPEKRRTVEVSTPAGIIGRAMLTSVIHMAPLLPTTPLSETSADSASKTHQALSSSSYSWYL